MQASEAMIGGSPGQLANRTVRFHYVELRGPSAAVTMDGVGEQRELSLGAPEGDPVLTRASAVGGTSSR